MAKWLPGLAESMPEFGVNPWGQPPMQANRNKRHARIANTPLSAKPQPPANRRLDELILIARLWPRESAWIDMDFGRPTIERNHFRKFTTHSTYNSADTPSRSMMGSRLSGIAPRLSVRTCRAVRSNKARYSPSPSGRKPLFEARRSVFLAPTA